LLLIPPAQPWRRRDGALTPVDCLLVLLQDHIRIIKARIAMLRSFIFVLCSLVGLPGLVHAQIDERKLLDLTYPFDERTIFWPNNKPFQWEKTAWGMTAGGYWYAAGNFCMAEHGGTH